MRRCTRQVARASAFYDASETWCITCLDGVVNAECEMQPRDRTEFQDYGREYAELRLWPQVYNNRARRIREEQCARFCRHWYKLLSENRVRLGVQFNGGDVLRFQDHRIVQCQEWSPSRQSRFEKVNKQSLDDRRCRNTTTTERNGSKECTLCTHICDSDEFIY